MAGVDEESKENAKQVVETVRRAADGIEAAIERGDYREAAMLYAGLETGAGAARIGVLMLVRAKAEEN